MMFSRPFLIASSPKRGRVAWLSRAPVLAKRTVVFDLAHNSLVQGDSGRLKDMLTAHREIAEQATLSWAQGQAARFLPN